MARAEKAKQARGAKVPAKATAGTKSASRAQGGAREQAGRDRAVGVRRGKAPVSKISVSLGAAEEKWAREKAAATGRSFSAVLNDALRRERQNEARLRLLEELGTSDISPEDLNAVRAEWRK